MIRARIFWIAAAVLVVAAGLGWALRPRRPAVCPPPPPPGPPRQVTVERLHEIRVARTLDLAGTVKPLRTALVSTRVTGRILELTVEEGDRVAAGQRVGRVDVATAAAQVGQARAGVAVAEAARRESTEAVGRARASLDAARAQSRELQAQLQEAEASARQAGIDQHRQDYMYRHGAVAKADLDHANTNLAVAQARVSSLHASIARSQADQEQARAAIDEADAAVARSAASIGAARSGVAVAVSDLPYGDLRAPFAGAVVRKMAHVGDLAVPGKPLLQIDDTYHLHLEVAAPEEALKPLRMRQDVTVRIPALDLSTRGHVYQIVPAADPDTHTFTVKISLAPAPGLIPGLYGRVRLPRGGRRVLALPASALVRRGQLVGAFTVQDGTARLHWITLGGEVPGGREVLSGLRAGDVIIRRPPADLVDGARVVTHE